MKCVSSELFRACFSLSTRAILLLGLCCFLSINPVQSSPADDDAEEDAESDDGDEEEGDGGKEDSNDE